MRCDAHGHQASWGRRPRRRMDMDHLNRPIRSALMAFVFILLAGLSTTVLAQGRMTIQATAKGTSTQLGRMVDINIYIEQYSTPDDQKSLIEAFKRSGQNGLVSVLEDMKPKGLVRFSSGGVGNDIKYIIELPSEKGRRLRLVTDRNLAFGELYNSTRSKDYSVG